MKFAACVLASALATAANAEVFYNINFESPVHIVGSTPATGAGPETPSRIVFGEPVVENGFGALNSQCLVFNQTSATYDQIELDLGRNSDLYFLSFDVITRNIDESLMSFTIFFDTPQVRTFSFHGLGNVNAFSPAGGIINHAYDFRDEQLMRVTTIINLTANTWAVAVNGNLAVEGQFNAEEGDVEQIRFSLSPWHGSISHDPAAYVAIDNIYVADTVPEPGTLLGLSVGGMLLMARRRAQRHSPQPVQP